MDRSKLLKEFEFKEEETELVSGVHGKTGFPKPEKSYKLFMEVQDLSLEEPYYWVLDTLKDAYPIVEKLEDSFAASENSAFFGVAQQKLGAQQDKISQYLATTGKMIKELFQMVRELRIIEERLKYYDGSEGELEKPISERQKGNEVTLKGMFVDLVQGGGKSAASVYGMARELEFVTLPDLFFDAPPFKTKEELENHVKNLGKDFNNNVLRVLVRHLTQFKQWKEQTAHEHKSRQRFMLSYLLQHFEIIKMYITWIKPYLRHVTKLTLKHTNMQTADMVGAFEGSMIDVEFLARQRDNSGANGCILATFQYRTRPDLKIHNEYQRGAIHVGRMEFQLRVYKWSDKEVENYKKLKDKEIFHLMGDVSKTVESAMESLGSELDKYLEKAKEMAEGKKEEKTSEPLPRKTIMRTLFGNFYTPKNQKVKMVKAPSAKELKKEAATMAAAYGPLLGKSKSVCWAVYNNFKKAHGMVTW
jgi:hypothetical protein